MKRVSPHVVVVVVLAAASLTLSAVAPVGAQPAGGAPATPPALSPAEARARELFEQAQRHFDLGEYDDAIAGYREAYRTDPRPGLLFNLGQAYRLKGDCVTAQQMYRSYLRLEPDSKYKAVVEENLASVEACARDQSAAGARAAGDPSAPPSAAPTGEASPPPRHDAGRTRRIAGIATASGGAVLAVAGAYFAVDASRAADEVSAGYERGAAWAELEDSDARGRRDRVLAPVLLVGGGVAIAAGATLYILGRRAEHAPVVAVTPSRGGASVGVSWRF